MCGITGAFDTKGRPVPINVIKKMTDAVRHRGPDGEGFWIKSFVGLGHRRLAIIDLSPLGHQPMLNDDESIAIVYNGEVYNFPELRKELERKGHRFRSRSDTEVLLKSYEEWGKECVQKFNGMFALAIWDARENTLVLARDRYGIKPLYYYFRDGLFLVASEIKGILAHSEVTTRVCLPALSEYFSFQNIFTDLTLFEGIRLLPPGSRMWLKLGDSNTLHQEEYWDFDFRESETKTEREYEQELTSLFEDAVRRQLISDVEIGSYLSGGIDSGSIACVTSRNFKNLKTFTCGFDLSSASGLELGFDERQKAEFLSNRYKTEHYEVVLKAGDMERVMPDLIWHLEDLRIGQSYPNYYVARLASKFVKVVLSGAGGDELFAGYPWRYYRAIANDDFESYVDKYFRYWQRIVPDDLKARFFQPPVLNAMTHHSPKEVFSSLVRRKGSSKISPEEYVNRSLYLEAKTFLHGILVVEDKLSMAHGLETRVPFLDNHLVDFAMKMPVKYKLKNLGEVLRINENEPGMKAVKYFEQTNDGKIILRKTLARYVPDTYAAGIKQGFSAPDGSWFKGESIEYIKSVLLNRQAKIYDFIKPDTAQELMNEHFSGKTNRRLLIWSLLCFEWWNKVFKPS